jgi:hypothetical protein
LVIDAHRPGPLTLRGSPALHEEGKGALYRWAATVAADSSVGTPEVTRLAEARGATHTQTPSIIYHIYTVVNIIKQGIEASIDFPHGVGRTELHRFGGPNGSRHPERFDVIPGASMILRK